MGLSHVLRPLVVTLGLAGALAGVVTACAKGETPDLGGSPDTNVPPLDATSPPPIPSSPLPPEPTPDSGNSDDSGGGTSSGGTSSGGTSSGGTSSGGTDAAVDAAKDAAVDSGGGTCATVAPSNACGLAPQCGCAANQTCDITNLGSGAVGCVLAGGGPLGSYCTTTTQCAKGFTCGYNACRPDCPTVGAACAGAGLGVCEQYYDPTAGTPVTNGKVCDIACDLRSPSTVCGSNNCIFDLTVNAPDCDKSGTLALYDPCTRYNDCSQGLACVNNPVYGLECERWCRLGGSDCGAFEDCIDVYGATAPSSGGVKLGHCE